MLSVRTGNFEELESVWERGRVIRPLCGDWYELSSSKVQADFMALVSTDYVSIEWMHGLARCWCQGWKYTRS